MNKEEIKQWMEMNQVDYNTRIDIPNGGIYLRNLLERFEWKVRIYAIADAKKAINDLLLKIEER